MSLSEDAALLDGLSARVEEMLKAYRLPDVTTVSKQFEETCDEVKQIVKEHRQFSRDTRKVYKEINSVEEGIKKAEDSLKNCAEKTKIVEKQIEQKDGKLVKERNAIESSLEAWEMLGIKFQMLSKMGNDFDDGLSDGDFCLIFTKLDPKNINKKFSVKVNVSNRKVKIYETEPRNILAVSDLNRIEAIANGDDQKSEKQPDFRALVVFLRKHIKDGLVKK